MLKTYLFLIGAIFCEVAGTMLLPVSQNFTKIIPTSLLAIFYLTAFYLSFNKLPIAIVYATWSGLGIFTIAILGYIFFPNFSDCGIISYMEWLVNSFSIKSFTIATYKFKFLN